MDFLTSVGELVSRSGDVSLQVLASTSESPSARPHYLVGPVKLPVRVCLRPTVFDWYVGGVIPDESVLQSFRNHEGSLNYEQCLRLSCALASGSVLVRCDEPAAAPLVRIHSCCATGDLFGSARCDCGEQLQAALSAIGERNCGLIVYEASHEGRGIGLLGKLLAYSLQVTGTDTYAANVRLGFPEEGREFGFAEDVISHFYAGRTIDLLTNNPMKLSRVARVMPDVVRVPLHGSVTPLNKRYLGSKFEYGHLLDVGSEHDLFSTVPADTL